MSQRHDIGTILSVGALRRFIERRRRATARLRERGAWFETMEPRQFMTASPIAPEWAVNPTSADESSAVVLADGLGDLVVVYRSDSSLLAQRYTKDGVAEGEAVEVDSNIDPSFAFSASMASNGRFAVVWTAPGVDLTDVFGRVFDATATPLGDAFLLSDSAAGTQLNPSVAIADNGRFAAAWMEVSTADVTLPLVTPTVRTQIPDFDPDTGALIVTTDVQDGSVDSYVRTVDVADIFARRFFADGSTAGGQFLVNAPVADDTTAALNAMPSVAMDSDGDFAVAWSATVIGAVGTTHAKVVESTPFDYVDQDGNDASVNLKTTTDAYTTYDAQVVSTSVMLQRYSAPGTEQGDAQTVDTTGNPLTVIAGTFASMDATGGLVVGWQATRFTATAPPQDPDADPYSDTPPDVSLVFNGSDLFARRYSNAGAAQGAKFKVVGTNESSVINGAAGDMDPDGAFVIAWSVAPFDSYFQNSDITPGGGDDTDTADPSVFGQRYDASGAKIGAPFTMNSTAQEAQSPSIAGQGGGHYAAGFQALGDATDTDVFLRLFGPPKANFSADITSLRIGGADATLSTLVPGDQLRVALSVLNSGQAAGAGTMTVSLYLSTDDQFDGPDTDAPDTLVADFADLTAKIAPGKSKSFDLSFAVETAMPTGSYFLIAVVDSANVVDESVEDDNLAVAEAALNFGYQFGDLGNRAASMTLPDADGTLVTFTLKGNGTGSLVLNDDGTWDVRLDDTDRKSQFTITTKKSKNPGDDGVVNLHGLDVNGSIKSITAKTTNLADGGHIAVSGSLASLTLAIVADQHTIDINDADNEKVQTVMTFAGVANLSITSASGIKSIKVAGSWIDDDTTPDVIAAPWLGSLTVGGDLQASLNLTGEGAKANKALGKVQVGGSLSGAEWQVTGDVSEVRVKGAADDFTLAATGGLKLLNLDSAGGVSLDLGGKLGDIKSNGWASGAIAAALFQNINIKGDFAANVTTTETGKASNNLKVTGVLHDATIRLAGGLNTASLGAMDRASLIAGLVNEPEGLPGDGDLADVGINAITVNGATLDDGSAFRASTIAAGRINKITLGTLNTQNAGQPFGVVAGGVNNYKRLNDPAAENGSFKLPGLYDPAGDYALHIIGLAE